MIDVGVRDDDRGQFQDSAIPEEGRHHALAGVEAIRPAGAGVHQHDAAVGGLDHDGLALADVEHAHAQPPVGRPQRGPQGQQRAGERERAGGEPQAPREP